MKTLKIIAYLVILLTSSSLVKANRNLHPENQTINILVVGFAGNVNSNFLPRDMVAERLEVCPSKFDSTFHEKLFLSFSNLRKRQSHKFIVPENLDETNRIRKAFTFKGENENVYAVVSQTNQKEFEAIMNQYDADYIMIFGQYYLKWREEPFNTFFHIVNYTVVNKEKKEVDRGMEFFTTFTDFRAIDVERQLAKMIRRNTDQISRAIN